MQVDFYILQHQTRQQQEYFVCQLAQKAYLRNHQLYIHTQHQQHARQIDQRLWTFQDISFVPHQLYNENENKDEKIPPILIGYQDKPDNLDDILINLSSDIPSFVDQFKRLIEIVADDAAWKNIMRQHYRYYRDLNYQLTIHKIEKAMIYG